MNVIFRTDASTEIGSGHVMRCLTLANAIRNIGGNVRFICKEHPSNLISKIIDSGYEVKRLSIRDSDVISGSLTHYKWLGGNQKDDSQNTIDFIQPLDVDWMIIDHYAIDEYWHKKIRPYIKRILVIDDLGDRKHDCDILLDQNLGSNREKYHRLVPKNCGLLLGPKYALLRPEFAEWRDRSLKRRSNDIIPKNIIISLGSVDHLNITSDIINYLSDISSLDNFVFNVIVGSQCIHLDSIREAARKSSNEINIYVDTDQMAELMAQADIAIGAGGSSAWERCVLGLPSIVFILADNQKYIAKMLQEFESSIVIQSIKELPVAIKKLQSSLNDYSKNAAKILDGFGTSRVVDSISLERFAITTSCEELIATNFNKLTKLDLLEILDARNHPNTRSWFFTKHIISREEHFAFINKLASSKTALYFHVSQNEEFVGVVSFTKIDWKKKTAYFGIYANLIKRVQFAGEKLIAAAEFIIRRMNLVLICLQVESNNNKAIALYEKKGFKIVGSKNINGLLYLDFEKKYL